MEKHLGLRYEYRNEDATKDNKIAELTPEMLRELSAELRAKLEKATRSLNSNRIDAVIQEISQHDAALGKIIAHCASNFNYPAILRALKEPRSG